MILRLRILLIWNSQHNVVPDKSLVSDITHVALAFMSPSIFNQAEPSSWPLFTTVDKARSHFAEGTMIMVAIGGWGDTAGFAGGAATEVTRKRFARNVKLMVDATGAHGKPNALDLRQSTDSRPGVDIDWEYPGLVSTPYNPLFAAGNLCTTEPNTVETVKITSRFQTRRKPGRSKPIHYCSRRFALPWVQISSFRLLYQDFQEICWPSPRPRRRQSAHPWISSM